MKSILLLCNILPKTKTSFINGHMYLVFFEVVKNGDFSFLTRKIKVMIRTIYSYPKVCLHGLKR